MSKRPALAEIGSIFSSATVINSNNDKIEDAFQNTLSRDGSVPNQMEADIDLNGNDLLNVKDLDVSGRLKLSGSYVSVNAEQLGRDWATTPEDVEVDPDTYPGEFSAYHYARKAEEAAALKSRNVYDVEDWGTPVTSAIVQQAWEDVRQLANDQDEGNFGVKFTLRCTSEVLVDEPVVMTAAAGGYQSGIDIDFGQARFLSVGTGSLTNTDYALFVKTRNNTVNFPYVDAQWISSGIKATCLSAVQNFRDVIRYALGGIGVEHSGGNGNSRVYNLHSLQYYHGDSNGGEYSNYSGIAWYCNDHDFTAIDPRCAWSEVVWYFGPNASLVTILGGHPWNGGPSSNIYTDPTLVECHSQGKIICHGTYFDNGLIHDHTGGKFITRDCLMFEFPSAVVLNDPHLRIYCSASTNGGTPLAEHTGLLNMSVGFYDSLDTNYSWGDNMSALNSYWSEQLSPSNSSVNQRDVNIYTHVGDTVPIQQNIRPEGPLRVAYISRGTNNQNNTLAMIYDPENSLIDSTANKLSLGGWGVVGEGGLLTAGANNTISPTNSFHRITNGGVASRDINTINVGNAPNGAMVSFCIATNDDDVVFKHNVDNIRCGSDRTLNLAGDVITFIRVDNLWRMISFSDNI